MVISNIDISIRSFKVATGCPRIIRTYVLREYRYCGVTVGAAVSKLL